LSDLERIEQKLDKILEFQQILEPYLPVLAMYLDNPASRFALARRKHKQ
jgi:hypothetical protein